VFYLHVLRASIDDCVAGGFNWEDNITKKFLGGKDNVIEPNTSLSLEGKYAETVEV
jgi:hypothetical protein